MDLANMDTPLLRDLYRDLMAEYNKTGMVTPFNAIVEAEMTFRGLEKTPRDYVMAGLFVLDDIRRSEADDFIQFGE